MSPRRKTRNASGTVAIVVRGGTLSLRFRTQGQQFRLALGLPNTHECYQLAQAKASEIQRDIALGEFDPSLKKYRPAPVIPSFSTPELFEKFIEFRLDAGTSEQAISARYKPLLANLKRFPSDICTPEQAKDFIEVIRNRQSPRIANQTLTLLKAFANWAVENEYRDENPFHRIRPIKGGQPVQNRTPFTIEEISQFFAALVANPKTAPYHDFCLALLSLGVRPSEAIGLRWQHVNIDKGTVTICESLSRGGDGNSAGYARQRRTTKTGNSRTLPLSPLLLEALSTRRPSDWQPDDLIFLTPKGPPIDDRRFRERIWKRTCKAAGIPYRPPYTSRHTLLSHGIESKGWTLPQAAKVAGHTNTRMIAERYGHALETPEFPEVR